MKTTMMTMAALAMLAIVIVGCDREITGDVKLADNSSQDCLQCHSGRLDQAQGEWANSVHASGLSVDYTNRIGSDCMACHDQEGFVQFLETGELQDQPYSTMSAIGCFTCHNPHETGTLELRTVKPYTLKNGDVFDHGQANLCVNCHHNRTNVNTIADNQPISNRFGPHHGPQGDLINGSGGYEFPGLSYNFPSSPHANQVTDACIGCHMANPEAHDGYDIGGHSWNMVAPEDEEVTLVEVCANSSCHPDVETFDFTAGDDYDNDGTTEGYQTEFEGLLDSLRALLYDQGLVDDEGTPVTDTVADKHLAGAVWNYVTVEEDRSEGVHNYDYIRSLLEASIDYVDGLPGRAPADDQVAVLQPSH